MRQRLSKYKEHTRELLPHAKKSLGQHFLMHARIAARIADAALLSRDTTVLEVGPGTGILTRELLLRADKVISVETDPQLIPRLSETFSEAISEERLTLIHADIRAFDLLTLPRGYVVVANIPYYLTGELFRFFLETLNQPDAITFLVQKEVAQRIVAINGKESLLSLSVRAYGKPKYLFTVPRGAFRPTPKMDSAALTIRDITRSAFITPAHEQHFFELIRTGFAHRRKFVRNNLEHDVSEALLSIIPEHARAEDLSLETWLDLSRAKKSE